MTTAITATKYNIELRNKDGLLKGYITPWVTDVNWEWNRLGGCGRCSITIKMPYRDLSFDALDDIQIRTTSGATSKLVYRGYIANVTPTLKIGQEIKLDVRGYFDLLKKVVVHTSGDTRTYTNKITSQIASDICDNFITRGSYDSYTKLLVHFDGVDTSTADYTAETGQTVSLEGTAQLDTAQYKFGGSSLLLDGDSDYATVPDSENWDFGTGNFTIDFWVRFAAIDTLQIFVSQYEDVNNRWTAYIGADNKLNLFANDGGVTKGAYVTTDAVPDLAINTWYHMAFVRNGTTALIFVNGTSLALTESTAFGTNDIGTNAATVRIGTQTTTTQFLNGWIDEVRISKGVARWTENFTPATLQYSPTTSTQITRGTIDIGSFSVDTIDFLCPVDEALQTLSELTGDVEYGVDEDLVFFWRTESEVVSHKFFVGNNISTLERKTNYDSIINKYYLVGGDVAGTKYKRTAENTDSQALYYLSEQIINNSSITSDTVADQYLGALLSEKASPRLTLRAKIENTDLRIEDTVPLGLITFYDPNYDRNNARDNIGDIYGEAADGGSDLTYGETGDGGSDAIYGSDFTIQIDRISYSLSDTDGRFNIEIQTGDTFLETSARIKKLELAMSSVTQY